PCLNLGSPGGDPMLLPVPRVRVPPLGASWEISNMFFGRRRAANEPQRSEPPSAAAATEADTAALMAAAQDLKDLLIAAYTDEDNHVHAETVLGAAAALTGEFALRAAGVPIPSGGFVLGDPINDVLIESKTEVTLWDVLKMTTDVTPLTEDQ